MAEITWLEPRLTDYFAHTEHSCGQQERLARWTAGEATELEAQAQRRHLETCQDCAADVAALNEAQLAWNGAHDVPRRRAPVRLIAGGLVALAASLALWVGLPASTLTAKGAPRVEVAVRREGASFWAETGSPLRTGDALGFFVTTPSPTFLTLLYLDASGPTVIFPETGSAAALSMGVRQSLPVGSVLTAGEGCERVFAVFSETALPTSTAKELIRSATLDARDCSAQVAPREGIHVQVHAVRR